jgi:hypothetical protein
MIGYRTISRGGFAQQAIRSTYQNAILRALGKRAADERRRGWKVAEDVLAVVVGHGDVQCA